MFVAVGLNGDSGRTYLTETYFDSSPAWAGMAKLSAPDYKPSPSTIFDDHPAISSRSCWNIATAPSFTGSRPLSPAYHFPATLSAAVFYGAESPLTSFMTSSLGNSHPRLVSSDSHASLMSAALHAATAEVTFHFYCRPSC